MRLLWDEPKRRSNIAKHGLDFAALTVAFFETAILIVSRENRIRAIGKHGTQIIAVIFLPLGSEAISIISMRSASIVERGLHERSQKHSL